MRTKAFPNPLTSLLAAVGCTLATLSALGQAPVISSVGQNGQLVCTNLQPGSTASVEWASSPGGPWTNNWAGLDAVAVNSNGMIQMHVPMFYRVRGLPAVPTAPAGMVLIPAGAFEMGDTFSEGNTNELPLHTVQVSAFYMDKYKVTKALWDEVKGWNGRNGYVYDNLGSGKAANHPVHSMTWFDAVKWCNARSEKEGLAPAYYTDAALTQVYKTGQIEPYVKWNAGYRLPTEAEWEKAARGGATGHRFSWSDTDNIAHSEANYYSTNTYVYDTSSTWGYHPTFNDGFRPYTSPVGYFAANGYGLYDMAGNLFEWCWDWYGLYSSGSQTDPHGPSSGSNRVGRGGSWYSRTDRCRTAIRGYNLPANGSYYGGFRSVLPADQ